MEQLKQILETLNNETNDTEKFNKYTQVYDLLKKYIVDKSTDLHEFNVEFYSFATKLILLIKNEHPAKEISLKILLLIISSQLCEQLDQAEICKIVFESLKHHGSEISDEFLCEHLKFFLVFNKEIFVSIAKNYLLVLREFFTMFFQEKSNCNFELKEKVLLLLELILQKTDALSIAEVDKYFPVSILHEHVIPLIIDPKTELRIAALKAVKVASSRYTTAMHVKSPHWETLKCSFIREYANVITGFLSERNSDWYRVWCCVVRILGTELHKGAVLVNCLLKIEETAFKSSLKDIRQQAFLCWQALVENFALDLNELCSSKRMKLLLIPLQANNCRTVNIALTKFNVWWCLIIAVQSQVSKRIEEVLLPFLNFCFGSFSMQIQNSTELTVKPGRRYKSLMPYVVDSFIQILGHEKPDCDCIRVTNIRLDDPILSDEIFKHASKIIFDSAVEATLCALTFEKDPSRIVSCMWISVLHLTVRRSVINPNIFNGVCTAFEKLTKNISESLSDHRGVVLCTVFNIVLKIVCLTDKKFYLMNLFTTFFKNTSHINFERTNLSKIIEYLSLPVLVIIIPEMISVFVEYFYNSECEAAVDVWLLIAKTIIEHFNNFEEESVLKILMVPLLKKYFQSVMCNWETLFKLSFIKFNALGHISSEMYKNDKFNSTNIECMYKSVYNVVSIIEINEKLIDEFINLLELIPSYDSSQKLSIGKDLVYIIKRTRNYNQYLKDNSDKIIGLMILLLKNERYTDGCEIFKNTVEILNFMNENDLITKLIIEILKYTSCEIEAMFTNIIEVIRKKNNVDSEIEQVFKNALIKYKESVQVAEKAKENELNEIRASEKSFDKKTDSKSTKSEMKTNLKESDKKQDSIINFENMPQLEKIDGTKIFRIVEIMPDLIKIQNLESIKKSDILKNQIDLKENVLENANNNSGKLKGESSSTQKSVKKILDTSIQKNIMVSHNLDTGNPVKLRISPLAFSSPIVSSRTKTILKLSDSKIEIKQKPAIKEHEQKEDKKTEDEPYELIQNDDKSNWEKMTIVQKEKTHRERDNIPCLFEDLAQPNSLDLFESNECKSNKDVIVKSNETSSVSQVRPQIPEKSEENQCLPNSDEITEDTSIGSSSKILTENDELKRVNPIRFRVNGNDVDIIRTEKTVKHLPVTISKCDPNSSTLHKEKKSNNTSASMKNSSLSRKKRSHKKNTDSNKPVTRRERAIINSKLRELKRIEIDCIQTMDFPKTRTRLGSQEKTSEKKEMEKMLLRNSQRIRTKNQHQHSETNVKNDNNNQEHTENNELSLSIINLMHKKMFEEFSPSSNLNTSLKSDNGNSNIDTESIPDDFQVDNISQTNFTSRNNSTEHKLFGTQQHSNNITFASNIISSPGESDMDGKSTEEFLNNTLEISPIKKNEIDNVKIENNAISSIELQKSDSELFPSISLSLPKQSKRNEKIMNLAKKLNITEIKESSSLSPRIIEVQNINGDKCTDHSDLNLQKNIHGFKLDLLEFEKQLPSPLAKPEASIIKRKRNSDSDDMMPAPKKKRVSFHDPPISSQVEYLPENFPKQLRSSKTARLPKKRRAFMKQKISTRNGIIKLSSEKSISTVVIDDDDAVDYNLESDNSKSNTISDKLNLNFSLEDSSDISLANSSVESCISDSELDSTQNSVDGKILDRSKPLYSPLISCEDDIKNIFAELVDPMWTQGLQNLLSENHIETIGDLASLSAAEIRSFPLLREKRTIKVLRKFEKLRQKIKDKEARKIGSESTPIDFTNSIEEKSSDSNSPSPISSKVNPLFIDSTNLTNELNFTNSKASKTDFIKDLAPSFEMCEFESRIEDHLKKFSNLINSTSVKISEDNLLQSLITRLIDHFGKERLYTALGTSFNLQYLTKYKTWSEIIEEIIQEAGFKTFIDSFSQMSESVIESRMDSLLENIVPKLPIVKNVIAKYHSEDHNNETITDQKTDPCEKLLQLAKKMPSHAVDNLIAMIESMQTCNKI